MLGLTCRLCRCPITVEAKTGRFTTKDALGPSIDERTFGKLCMWWLILLHRRLLLANKNLVRGPWWLRLQRLCGIYRFLREFLRVALGLWPCWHIEGGDRRRRSYIGHCQLSGMPWLFPTFWCVLWHCLARNNSRGMPLLAHNNLHPLLSWLP
jgi:hypothetical protein